MQDPSVADQATSFFFKKVPQLKIISAPIPISQFIFSSRQRDTSLQFQLITQLTDTKRHKILLHHTSAQERVLNRYRDERICISNSYIDEHSRVKLNKKVEDKFKDIDYINASIVFEHPFKIILTQGPKLGTIKDFYMMIKQEKTEYVIMLCNLKEDGKKKCQNYYNGDNEYEVFETLEVSKTIVVRSIRDPKTNHSFKQIHYTGWDDHSIPQKYEDITTIINLMDTKKGVTIHCSAGIGRSGALAVLLKCLKDIQRFNKVSVFQNAVTVRENRYGSIKNAAQYQFIYDYLRMYIEAKNNLI